MLEPVIVRQTPGFFRSDLLLPPRNPSLFVYFGGITTADFKRNHTLYSFHALLHDRDEMKRKFCTWLQPAVCLPDTW